MFGIGFTEILVILVVALIVLGPDKLPEIAKTLGKAVREFRRTSDEIRKTVSDIDVRESIDRFAQQGDTPATKGGDEKVKTPMGETQGGTSRDA
jgi:Tat protein translocase TatB subunit